MKSLTYATIAKEKKSQEPIDIVIGNWEVFFRKDGSTTAFYSRWLKLNLLERGCSVELINKDIFYRTSRF